MSPAAAALAALAAAAANAASPAPVMAPAPVARSAAEEGAPAAPLAAEVAPLPTPRPEPGDAPARAAALASDAPEAPPSRSNPRRGAQPLCGDPRLSGARLPRIDEGACGIERPVRLSAVSGVRLTRPVTVGCGVAAELAGWVERVARPAARERFDAELVEMTSYAGYVCRPVNNVAGASLSHHALGEAVDLGAFRLSSGREVAVTEWGEGGAPDEFLRDLWEGACGPFGTVLGPEADVHHEDHLHLDVAERRRAYCR